MSAPAIGLRPRFAPGANAHVDWSHPLAAGLEFCVVPSAGINDLARGYVGTISGSPTLSPGPLGVAGNLSSGTSDFYEYSGVPDAPFLGPMTMMWVGVMRTASAFRSLVHKHASNGGNANPLSYYVGNSASPMTITSSRAASNNRNFETAGCFATNTTNTVVVTHPSGTVTDAPTFYVNGLVFSGTGAGIGTGAVTGSQAAVRVGRRADGSTQTDGLVHACMLWSRALSANEAAALTADPFCMLRY
jgi:hypothetical protein